MLPSIVASGAAEQRYDFAYRHLKSALIFSLQFKNSEIENFDIEIFDYQTSCVSAVVLLTVAALESNLNECFLSDEKLFPDYPDYVRKEFCSCVERLGVLDKYQRTLSFLGLEKFRQGENLFQDVAILVNLRNELVHFHPELYSQQTRHKTLGKKLQGRFKLSKILLDELPVFPMRYVSYECTRWALRSSYNFMSEFNKSVGFDDKLNSLGALIEQS